MKTRVKLALIAVTVGAFVMQLGQCARFLGDLAGDALWLRGID